MRVIVRGYNVHVGTSTNELDSEIYKHKTNNQSLDSKYLMALE